MNSKNFKDWIIYTAGVTAFGMGMITLIVGICESLDVLTMDKNVIWFLTVVIGLIVSTISYWV